MHGAVSHELTNGAGFPGARCLVTISPGVPTQFSVSLHLHFRGRKVLHFLHERPACLQFLPPPRRKEKKKKSFYEKENDSYQSYI